ncbi:hypothetical protein FRC20_005131 [Serendipita sp. 405]|nr:hypothetical protein FRC15_004151 [Serendipita sp. 397]KAG8867693.1 hypothetical protein FRC20_005131 [Serendipita sp. 405]
MDQPIPSIEDLPPVHKHLFARAGIRNCSDVWMNAPSDIARKLKVSTEDVQAAIDALCSVIAPKPTLLAHSEQCNQPGCFTTGDPSLDEALGGGVRLGMMTEICGESSSGKTQLALQLALTAQLREEENGVNSGVAYFTTTSALPVKRLTELASHHPKLRDHSAKAFTDNVHACSTSTVPALISVIKHALPQLCKQAELSKGKLKPIRVLVIDSLGSLFQSINRTTTSTLVERAKSLNEVSQLLHSLASSRNMAIIVINQVTDIFQSPEDPYSYQPFDPNAHPSLIYKEQAVWFNRGPSTGARSVQEATLGLIWANQLNVRLMLTRTKRRVRPPTSNDKGNPNKRQKTSKKMDAAQFARLVAMWNASEEDEGEMEDLGQLVRNLAVLFSGVSGPVVLDFVVEQAGIRVLEVRKPTNGPPKALEAIEKTLKPQPAPSVAITAASETTDDTTKIASQGFISARLTQKDIFQEDEDKPSPKRSTNVELTEDDFDDFDEKEWAAYGIALGDLEEQWDISEPDNQSVGLSDRDIEEEEILESSDVEENLLL